MTCFTCNALVPDGAQTCPRCGAKMNSDGAQNNVAPWNRIVNQPRNYGEEKREFVLEATDSLRKTYHIRRGQMLIYALSFGLTVITLIVKKYMYSNFVNEHDFVFNILPKLLSGANLVLMVLLLLRLSDLAGYEERFNTVLKYAVLVMICTLASMFVTGIVGLLISITGLLSTVLFMYHYCGAFSDLTGVIDDNIARKWNLLLIITIVTNVLHLGGLLFVYFGVKNARSVYQLLNVVDSTIIWSFIFALLEVLVMIIEIIIFSKTVKCFENQR